MDDEGADRLLREVVVGLPPALAALLKERVSPAQLRELTKEAAITAARDHSAEDTIAEATIKELRRLILTRLPESARP